MQEFDLEIKDKKGSENYVADHLSRLTIDEKLFNILIRSWFAKMTNFEAVGALPDDLTWHQKKKFFRDVKHLVWNDPYLFKIGANNLLRRCVTQKEARRILWHCHSSPYGGHYNGERTAIKVLQSGFFWPTFCKDAHKYVQRCDKCQRIGGLSRRNEMPLQSILEVEAFDY